MSIINQCQFFVTRPAVMRKLSQQNLKSEGETKTPQEKRQTQQKRERRRARNGTIQQKKNEEENNEKQEG
jgi:hypothetical protein